MHVNFFQNILILIILPILPYIILIIGGRLKSENSFENFSLIIII